LKNWPPIYEAVSPFEEYLVVNDAMLARARNMMSSFVKDE
jgi:hypothetical protein